MRYTKLLYISIIILLIPFALGYGYLGSDCITWNYPTDGAVVPPDFVLQNGSNNLSLVSSFTPPPESTKQMRIPGTIRFSVLASILKVPFSPMASRALSPMFNKT